MTLLGVFEFIKAKDANKKTKRESMQLPPTDPLSVSCL